MTITLDETLTAFQTSLRQGMGLWEALQKHNLTLKQAMGKLDPPYYRGERKPKPKKKYLFTIEPYIYKRGRNYSILKSVKGKTVDFGAYSTLEEAQQVKEYCMENGWYRSKLDTICKELDVKRVNKIRSKRR